MPKETVSKNSFRDTINYVLNDFTYNIHNIKRRDFISRTLIIIVLIYDLKENQNLLTLKLLKGNLKKL